MSASGTVPVLELRLMDADGYPGADAAEWDEDRQAWGWPRAGHGEWTGVCVVDVQHGLVVVRSPWRDGCSVRSVTAKWAIWIGAEPVDESRRIPADATAPERRKRPRRPRRGRADQDSQD